MLYRLVVHKNEIKKFISQQVQPIVEGKIEKDLVFENSRQIGVWVESGSENDAIDKSIPVLVNYINQHVKRIHVVDGEE